MSVSATADILINATTLGATAGLIGILVFTLLNLQHSPCVKVLQPRLHSLLILLNLLLMFIYLLSDEFLIFSWGVTGILIYSIVAWIHVVVFYIVANYYLAFCASEDKLKLALKVVRRLDSFKGLTEEYSSRHIRVIKILVKDLRWKVVFSFTVWALSIIPVLISFNIDGSFYNKFDAKSDNRGTAPYTVGVVALALISSVFIGANIFINWQMKKRNKHAGVRALMQRNYTYASSLVCCAVILYISAPKVNNLNGFHFRPFIIFEIHMMIYCFSFLASLFPYRNDVRKVAKGTNDTTAERFASADKLTSNPSEDQSNYSLAQEIEATLSDENGWNLLLEEARQQFCVENVLFYGAVEDWKRDFKSCNVVKRKEQASVIIQLFCSEESTAEVNLSGSTKGHLVTTLSTEEEVSENLFDNAQSEVLGLIIRQTFVRLRASSTYKEYMKKKQNPLV